MKCKVYGVRYPQDALKRLNDAGIDYGGWLPNYKVPEIFSRYKMTVHIPRKPYVEKLPGIPTIRPFEALACGIPLISAYWNDAENLFGETDFIMADSGGKLMKEMSALMNNSEKAESLRKNGLNTILSRHTCAHRVDELESIYNEIIVNRESGKKQKENSE